MYFHYYIQRSPLGEECGFNIFEQIWITISAKFCKFPDRNTGRLNVDEQLATRVKCPL